MADRMTVAAASAFIASSPLGSVEHREILSRYVTTDRRTVESEHPLATSWQMFDNSQPGRMSLIAAGAGKRVGRAPRFGDRSNGSMADEGEKGGGESAAPS